MATFTYECAKCEKRFEETQSVHDDPLTKCNQGKCKGKVKRIIVPGGSFRIGGLGVHNPTTRWNTSDDMQYRKN